jgi:hypothetical protein
VIAAIVLVAALAGLALAAFVLSAVWDGSYDNRDLAAGQSVTMDNGLTFTVPPAWEASYSRYAVLPTWLAVWENATGLRRTDYLDMRVIERAASQPHIMAMSFAPPSQGEHMPRGPVLAKTDTVTTYRTTDPTRPSIRAETHVVGRPVGWVAVFAPVGSAPGEPRRIWELANVSGVVLP